MVARMCLNNRDYKLQSRKQVKVLIHPMTGETAKPRIGPHPPPSQLVEDLESLGPTFVKLGQLLSTRPGIYHECPLP